MSFIHGNRRIIFGIPKSLEPNIDFTLLQDTTEYQAVLGLKDLSSVCVTLFVNCLQRQFGMPLMCASRAFKLKDVRTLLLADIHHEKPIKALNTLAVSRLIKIGDALLLEDYNPTRTGLFKRNNEIQTNAISMDKLPNFIFIGRWDVSGECPYYNLALNHFTLMSMAGFVSQLMVLSHNATPTEMRWEASKEILEKGWRLVAQEDIKEFMESLPEGAIPERMVSIIHNFFPMEHKVSAVLDRCFVLIKFAYYFLGVYIKKSWETRQQKLLDKLNCCQSKKFRMIFLIGGRRHIWQTNPSKLESSIDEFYSKHAEKMLVLGPAEKGPQKESKRASLMNLTELEEYYSEMKLWEKPINFIEYFSKEDMRADNFHLAASAVRWLKTAMELQDGTL